MRMKIPSLLFAFLFIYSFIAGENSQKNASSRETKPIPIPRNVNLPDLKPVTLYYNSFCNMYAAVKNMGKVKMTGHLAHVLKMEGKQISSTGSDISLNPGETKKILICSKAILGSWTSEIHEWELVLDPGNKVLESNEKNNTIKATIKCQKRISPIRK